MKHSPLLLNVLMIIFNSTWFVYHVVERNLWGITLYAALLNLNLFCIRTNIKALRQNKTLVAINVF